MRDVVIAEGGLLLEGCGDELAVVDLPRAVIVERLHGLIQVRGQLGEPDGLKARLHLLDGDCAITVRVHGLEHELELRDLLVLDEVGDHVERELLELALLAELLDRVDCRHLAIRQTHRNMANVWQMLADLPNVAKYWF